MDIIIALLLVLILVLVEVRLGAIDKAAAGKESAS